MLISHRFRFIYLKTMKTASTSVEVYFAPYCRNPEDRVAEKPTGEAAISQWGVVGHRGPLRGGETFYNHMPAQQILTLIGHQMWSEYFKFCVIRNPFGKVVSHFWFKLRLENPALHSQMQTADFSEVRMRSASGLHAASSLAMGMFFRSMGRWLRISLSAMSIWRKTLNRSV
jgi:hypothetical protein